MSASVNVLAPLFSDVYFPTYSNSLKDVARYLGFSWRDPTASGLQSLAWRARWELTAQFDGYLRQYQRSFIAAVENLWDKYAVTTKQILAERDQEAAQLDSFLKELGYE
jgi:predicted RecB family nuclease